MIRFPRLLTGLIALVGFASSAGAAQACTVSWASPTSGSWGTAADWSPQQVPVATDNVCITLPGTYTVTLGATDTNGGGANVASLTLGASSGTQTLDVAGQDYNYGGETYNSTTLSLSAASSINTGGKLILDATSGGDPVGGGNQLGGSAILNSVALTNAGQIVAQSEDSAWQEFYEGTLTNESSGSIEVNSGKLTLPSPNTGGVAPSFSYSLTNDGAVGVGSGAAMVLAGGLGNSGAFVNNGPVSNNGAITAVDQGGQMTWTQSGGSVSGNNVVMQDGAWLVDSVGSGSFLFNDASGALSGTIPLGQTVTVQGEAYSYGGENYNSTTLGLNANGNTSPVVNDGTLVLDAPGTGSTSGGNTYLTSGSLVNNGTLVTQVEDSAWGNNLQASVTNASAGNIDVNSGALTSSGSVTATNSGTVTVAPGAQWALNEGAALANAAGGTIVPEIASATSVGTFQVTSPCCYGPGSIAAGGTLAPKLVGGFTPAAGQEFQVFLLNGGKFTGTFGTVGAGFTGDYTSEAASPAFVGVLYGKPASILTVGAIGVAKEKLSVALSCSAGSGACPTASIVGTVTEHFRGRKLTAVTARSHPTTKTKHPTRKTKVVVVATAASSLAAGAATPASITLNRTGRALLAQFHKLTVTITVTVSGKAAETGVVVVHAPAKPQHKHSKKHV